METIEERLTREAEEDATAIEALEMKLAESQAREAELRAMLCVLAEYPMHIEGHECETCSAQIAARAALARPTDDSALREHDEQLARKFSEQAKKDHEEWTKMMYAAIEGDAPALTKVLRDFGLKVAMSINGCEQMPDDQLKQTVDALMRGER